MRYLLSISFLFISFLSIGQEFADKEYYLVDSLDLSKLDELDRALLDSCLQVYHSTENELDQFRAVNDIIEFSYNYQLWSKYSFWLLKKLIVSLKQKNYDDASFIEMSEMLIWALSDLGNYYENIGESEKAVKFHSYGLRLSEIFKDNEGIAQSLNSIAYTYGLMGRVSEALELHHRSMMLCQEIKDTACIAFNYNNLAFLYEDQGEINKALDYYKKAYSLAKRISDFEGVAASAGNIASIYEIKKDYDKALIYYQKGLKICQQLGDKKNEALELGNIGLIYDRLGETEKAMSYWNESLRIREQLEDKYGLATIYLNIGRTEYEKGSILIAEEYARKSLTIGKELGFPFVIEVSAELLTDIYEVKRNYKESLAMYKLQIQMRDSIKNEENQKATIRQQTQYEFEKEQIHKENEAKEKARVEAEQLKRRNNLQYSLIFLGILLLFGIVLSLGFIKVTPNVAEGLIFFAFLILFEFVLVFVEPYLNEYTDGEPIYTLIANAGIALLIFPLHDVLENRLKRKIVKK